MSDYMNYQMAVGAVRSGVKRIRRIDWADTMYVSADSADDLSSAALVLITDGVESDYSPTDDDRSGDDWVCF